MTAGLLVNKQINPPPLISDTLVTGLMLGAPLCGAKNEKTSEKNCDNSSGDNYYE